MKAEELNERAGVLREEGALLEAESTYRKAIIENPIWPAPWYNLGLLLKYQHRWQESLECNLRAGELDPSDEGAWWNLGIAATAIENWEVARNAWKRCGIPIPEGDGPVELNIGLTPIRINAEENPEVVWCRRIDPARAIVDSVPLPSSDRRWSDLLLHDGAPNGYRELNGMEVPVFDELQVLRSSDYNTYRIVAHVTSLGAARSLTKTAYEAGLAAENWSENIGYLCKECSEGIPHKHHSRKRSEYTDESIFAFAANNEEQINNLLESWLKQWPGCTIRELSLILESADKSRNR